MFQLLSKIIFWFLGILFVLTTILHLATNFPPLQKKLIAYINDDLLKDHSIKINLESIEFNVIKQRVTLRRFTLQDKHGLHVFLDHAAIKTNLYNPTLWKTSFIESLTLETVNVVFPLTNSPEPHSDQPPKNTALILEKIIGTVFKNKDFFPKLLYCHDISFELFSPDRKLYHFSHIDTFKASQTDSEIPAIELELQLSNSITKHNTLSSDIKILPSSFDILINQKNQVIIRSIDLNSNVGDLAINGILQPIQEDLKLSLFLNSNIDIASIAKILGTTGEGRIKFSGKLDAKDLNFDDLLFQGKINWEKAKFSFGLFHSGSTELCLKKRILTYNNLSLVTQQQAVIKSHGFYELFDEFRYENNVKIEGLTLPEILSSLSVMAIYLHLKATSDNIKATGFLAKKNSESPFQMNISTDIFVEKFNIPTVVKDEHIRFPNLNAHLELLITKNGLYMTNKTFFLEKNPGSIVIKNCFINFKNAFKSRIDFKIEKADLSFMESLFESPTRGSAYIEGVVGDDFDITTKIRFINLDLLSFRVPLFVSQVDITSQHVIGKNTLIYFNSSENEKLLLENFSIHYDTLRLILKGSASNTNIGDIVRVTQNYINSEDKKATGLLEKLTFDFNGLLFEPKDWDIKAQLLISNAKLDQFTLKELKAKIDCKNLQFKNSSLSYTLSTPYSTELSQGKVDLNLLTDKEIFLAMKIKNTDLRFFRFFFKDRMKGLLNVDVKLSGPFDRIIGFFDTSLEEARFKNIEFKSLQINASDNKKGALGGNIILFQENNTLENARLSFELGEQHNIDLAFKNADLLNFITNINRFQFPLISSLSGHIALKNQLPFLRSDFNTWLKNWIGDGFLSFNTLQYKTLLLQGQDRSPISVSKGKIDISSLLLSNKTTDLGLQVTYDFVESKILSRFKAFVDLSEIHKSFPAYFTPSVGFIKSAIKLEGPLNKPNLSGFFDLSADTLALRDVNPPLSSFKTHIVFEGQKATVTGTEEGGENGKSRISLNGNIDFESLFQNGQGPKLDLMFELDHAQFRPRSYVIPFIDTISSGEVHLSGDAMPYLLKGKITLHKLALFKDSTCNRVISDFLNAPQNQFSFNEKPSFTFDLEIEALNTISVQSPCLYGKFSTAPTIQIKNTNISPTFSGGLITSRANLRLLRANFFIHTFNLRFNEDLLVRSTINLEMTSQIENYSIYAKIAGPLNNPLIDLESSPDTLANGDEITKSDIAQAISSGSMPLESGGIFSVGMNAAQLFLSDKNDIDSILTSLSGGLIDSGSFEPISTPSGQAGQRISLRGNIKDRLNIGIVFEDTDTDQKKSFFLNWLINNTVNVQGGFDITSGYENVQINNDYSNLFELFGGLRFNFGSR